MVSMMVTTRTLAGVKEAESVAVYVSVYLLPAADTVSTRPARVILLLISPSTMSYAVAPGSTKAVAACQVMLPLMTVMVGGTWLTMITVRRVKAMLFATSRTEY